jgi:hypothetical protein
MLRELFIDHPASVDESYLEHMGVASGFGTKLLFAGCVCMVHAIIPGLFKTTGSRIIAELYQTMVNNRRRKHGLTPQPVTYDAMAFDAVI